MGKKGKKDRWKHLVECDPSMCDAHAHVERALDDFKMIADKIADNQVSLQINLAKLTESMEGVKRLGERVEKVEGKVDENSKLMYKMVGIGMAGAVVVPIVLQKFM